MTQNGYPKTEERTSWTFLKETESGLSFVPLQGQVKGKKKQKQKNKKNLSPFLLHNNWVSYWKKIKVHDGNGFLIPNDKVTNLLKSKVLKYMIHSSKMATKGHGFGKVWIDIYDILTV